MERGWVEHGHRSQNLPDNSQGGAVQVYSDFSLDSADTTTARISRCRFSDSDADYLGTAVYSAQSMLVLEDSELYAAGAVADGAEGSMTNLVYVAGGEAVSKVVVGGGEGGREREGPPRHAAPHHH